MPDLPISKKCPYYKDLVRLWEHLVDKGHLTAGEAGYPVRHGKTHIEAVLGNLCFLISTIGTKHFEFEGLTSDQAVYQLTVATFIHDLAMKVVGLFADEGDLASRVSHAHPDRLIEFVKETGVQHFVDEVNLNKAVWIAWAHTGDPDDSSVEKLKEVVEQSKEPGWFHLELCVRVLRFADLLDLGPHRLNELPQSIPWREDQIIHYRKHKLAGIEKSSHQFSIAPVSPLPGKKLQLSPAIYRVIKQLEAELKDQLDGLNHWLKGWRVTNRICGEISKVVVDIDLDFAFTEFDAETQNKFIDSIKKLLGNSADFPVEFVPGSVRVSLLLHLEEADTLMNQIDKGALSEFKLLSAACGDRKYTAEDSSTGVSIGHVKLIDANIFDLTKSASAYSGAFF